MPAHLRRVLHWIGSALALLGVAFIVVRLKQYAAGFDLGSFDAVDWIVLSALATVYGASNIMLALAWRNLLYHCGERTALSWAVRTYGISQLAKYIPGNVFHFAGRQAIGASAGLRGWPLARSALWELGLMAVVGALFSLLALPLVIPAVSPVAAIGFFTLAIAIAAAASFHLLGKHVVLALGELTIFLFISGAVFVGVLIVANPWWEIGWKLIPTLCGAYVVAWLIGLVTPGAPAGVGIREFTLLFLMSGLFSESTLLLAVVLGRVVSVVGDVLFFAGVLRIDAGVRED